MTSFPPSTHVMYGRFDSWTILESILSYEHKPVAAAAVAAAAAASTAAAAAASAANDNDAAIA